MGSNPPAVHEDQIQAHTYPDRWSKDLIGSASMPTTSGFNMGVAEYHATAFGPLQVHDDQEAIYVISGVGEIQVSDTVIAIRPGSAVYIPPGTAHATRRTTQEPVKVVYAHGAV